jgi:hypothetical protein
MSTAAIPLPQTLSAADHNGGFAEKQKRKAAFSRKNLCTFF